MRDVGLKPCHGPMSRAERRRAEREIAGARPARGLGQGWRINVRGRRYSVKEPPARSYEDLLAESEAVARRLGCTCEGDAT